VFANLLTQKEVIIMTMPKICGCGCLPQNQKELKKAVELVRVPEQAVTEERKSKDKAKQ
jgi:hypothetical protein